MSVATSFSLPVRLAANFYRTRVIAFSSVTVDPSYEREHIRSSNVISLVPFFRSCLSLFSPWHSTTTHAASGSRHVTRVRRTEAHNARVARMMRGDCTGGYNCTFSFLIDDCIGDDAADQHEILELYHYVIVFFPHRDIKHKIIKNLYCPKINPLEESKVRSKVFKLRYIEM